MPPTQILDIFETRRFNAILVSSFFVSHQKQYPYNQKDL